MIDGGVFKEKIVESETRFYIMARDVSIRQFAATVPACGKMRSLERNAAIDKKPLANEKKGRPKSSL